MAQTTRTFRIFVSSTFSDLKAERNALQKCVFSRLHELSAQHGCRFRAIDLRWGVREETALDQQTMRICLEEIARCQRVTPKPNFIVLLGDRYGRRPLPFDIPTDELEEIEAPIADANDLALPKPTWKHTNATSGSTVSRSKASTTGGAPSRAALWAANKLCRSSRTFARVKPACVSKRSSWPSAQEEATSRPSSNARKGVNGRLAG